MWLLIFFLFLFEIFSPWLIATLNLPQELRWLSHFANSLILVFYIFRRIETKKVYAHDLFLIFISALSIIIAFVVGQPLLPTIWGVWLFIRYPIIGFAARDLKYGEKRDRSIEMVFYAILLLEIMVQVLQSFSGIPNGDNVGGTFHIHGTGMLLFVILIILCYFTGKWIAEKKTAGLLMTLAIGIISSTLGEMKLFFFASILIALFAVILYFSRHKFDRRVFWGILIILIVIIVFPMIIDKYTYTQSNSISFWDQITDPTFIRRYTTFVARGSSGIYDVGRNYMVRYVWNTISSDWGRFIFGDGIGSRGESQSLGTAGVQLLRGNFGLLTGQSLVVFLGEMGILSILYFGIFMIFTIRRCVKTIRLNQAPYLVSLGYAVLLFSVFWPIWLWYNTAWILPGSMPLYWMMWGIAMQNGNNR